MNDGSMAGRRGRAPWLPPRWVIRLAWYTNRGLYRITGGRVGLWRARGNRWGTVRHGARPRGDR